ncbi:hypothetical protein CH251_08550 [Rhodococcus sp. 06-462-5]|uniref:hypothetical protein n=1 Tax=unclassified Rhodococcus (in: high G+C Gram-positive bacteria) TaxID=192944 RepID=UPI000B9AAEE2|nr:MULTISPECIES: hypothetical protein [unclassified Rhodococcus (in: high G+C Gram-positive bacteria)]OZC75997.1 hypothetical protein CH251_08550 [Rhodococcus sp. 06-462-5]OZE70009.1 hypothetical protein CH270_01445 [Rhodococcus sp. 02-925g]
MGTEDDPFAGMTSAERKRAHERIILEFVYRPDDFDEIDERERPDFALRSNTDTEPIGVEITQMFPDGSHARVHMMPGYLESLWKGARHRHRDDVDRLQSTTVKVTDKDGNVKHENLPVVLVEHPPTRSDFHTVLAETIEGKSGLHYDYTEFQHINLIVLDWFRLDFNAQRYSASLLLNDRVRDALRTTPFREVHLLTYDTGPVRADDSSSSEDIRVEPVLKRVPLKELLLVDRFYCACAGIHEILSETERDDAADYLNRVACEFVTRRLGIGRIVSERGGPHVQFGAAAVTLTADAKFEILEYLEHSYGDAEPIEILERLTAEQEERLVQRLREGAFEPGLAYETHDPPSRSRRTRADLVDEA